MNSNTVANPLCQWLSGLGSSERLAMKPVPQANLNAVIEFDFYLMKTISHACFLFSSISFFLFRQLLLLQVLKSRILCKSGDARREHERFSKVANIVIPLEGLDYCD